MSRFQNKSIGVAVSLQFDSSQYKRFESLTHKSAAPASASFSTDDGLAVLVEASAPGVFRVRLGVSKLPNYKLLARTEPMGDALVEPIKGGWKVQQGEDAIEILASPLRVNLIRKGEVVLASAVEESGRDKYRLAPFGHAAKRGRWSAAFGLKPGEPVYGLGERLGSLDRRGQLVLGHAEGASTPEIEISRKNVPFCWTTGGWGVFAHTPGAVRHGVGYAQWGVNTYLLDIEDDCLDLFFFVGEPHEILNHYSQLTGRAALPPLWSLGVWTSRALSGAPEQAVDTAKRLRERGLPCDVITLDGRAAWEVKTRFGFEWDKTRFEDPRRMLSALKAQHLKSCMWEYPYVSTVNPMFAELEAKGWLMKDRNGNTHVFEWDGAPGLDTAQADDSTSASVVSAVPAGVIDFTHPDACVFWRDKHKQLFEDGVDVMKSDFGAGLNGDLVGHNKDSGARLHNVYSLLYNRCVYEATAAFKGPNDAIVWGRDGFISSQRNPVQWGGNARSDWLGMAASIRAALTWGMSGAPCHSGDVAAPADATPESTELYVRWIANSVFSSHFRVHGLVDRDLAGTTDELEKTIKTWLAFRYRLIPYLMGAVEDAQRNGLPVMRAMPLAFPKDKAVHACELQYLLGPALLVAPIVSPDGKVEVTFPRGEAWWDLNTGWRYEGGSRWMFELGLGQLPVFGREGHMLCLGPTARHTGEFNSARILEEVWMFGMPIHNPCVMRNKIRVMQMQGSSYAKGLEGLKILPSEGLEIKRRGAEVRISRKR